VRESIHLAPGAFDRTIDMLKLSKAVTAGMFSNVGVLTVLLQGP